MTRAAALILAGALAAWPQLLVRVPQRWRPLAAAGASGALAAAVRPELGLRPPQLGAGLRTGGVVAAAVSTAVGASTAIAPVRESMRAREVALPPAQWLGLHIPVGTVWSEELAFRGVLQPLAERAFGPRAGGFVQAVAFGLAHIAPARAAGEPVALTVGVTGVAGWLFGWLRSRTGSVAAPVLAHLALNAGGAVAVLAVRRRSPVAVGFPRKTVVDTVQR